MKTLAFCYLGIGATLVTYWTLQLRTMGLTAPNVVGYALAVAFWPAIQMVRFMDEPEDDDDEWDD